MERHLGVFFSLANGNGYIKLDGGGEIYIYSENKGPAMHKDLVEARILKQTGDKTIGAITKVVERGNAFIVGTCVKVAGHMAIIPDDKRITEHIYLEGGAIKHTQDHKLAVEITKQGSATHNAFGKVISDLGHKDEPGVDILSVIYQMEIPYIFPQNVLNAAARLPETIDKNDCKNRRDLTDKLTITIDSKDTKDIDDAVSLEIAENGDYLLTVSIADVAHYVNEASALDKEALKRGTSIYLADRVIPMLPRELSNGICSLNEGELRLALSCEMRVNKKGKVISKDIFEGVIRVDKKMTYDAVSEVLTYGRAHGDYIQYESLLRNCMQLYEILKDKRLKRGAIEFEFTESKITLNAFGRAEDVAIQERNVATGIIEEFMILCNETVAEEYFWLGLPFIYRCHEEPDAHRRQKFTEFLKTIGYSIKGKNASAYQALLARAKDTPQENMVGAVMLRSLQQAKYTNENIGHFGLASACYCHFTSPIRRYPDLQIHRIIKEHLNSKLTDARIAHYNEILPEVCRQTSNTERRAVNCERDVENMKKIEYMSGKIGETYEGLISGVTNFGIFVALPNTAEGMVAISGMDDRYRLDEAGLTLTGEYTKKVYRIGQSVKVRVIKANAEGRKLDFKFI